MVDIQITGVRYDISDKLRGYISDKFGGLNRYHSGLKRLHVTIHEAEKHGFRVDVDMHLPNHHEVAAHNNDETIYAALDGLKDKCTSQLHKIHDKEARHRIRA